MLFKVPFLEAEQIERAAEALVAEYQLTQGAKMGRAVPIEDIGEKHLGLGIEFDDLHKRLGIPRSIFSPHDPDIVGAIFLSEGRILIDEALDPEERPTMEGRYRFTYAHEIAHWQLHRSFMIDAQRNARRIIGASPTSVVCRTNDRRARIEWQADRYAAALLMPRASVLAAWREIFPDCKPRLLASSAPIDHSFVVVRRSDLGDEEYQKFATDDTILDELARPIAEQFLVSRIAARIRLEHMGLLLRKVPTQGHTRLRA